MSLHPGCPSNCFNFYSPFFLPETTLSLPVGCCAPRPWLWVLQGDKQVLVSAEHSAQPGSMRAASPILSPQSATGVQGKGGGGQGAPPPGFSPSTVGQPATQSGLRCSRLAWEFGGSLLGRPRTWALSAVCWHRWQERPILCCLGRRP